MLTKQKIPSGILNKILSQFDLGQIIKIEPLSTSGNISYIIKTKSKSYFLRLSPSGHRWRSRKEIAAELEVINYLKKNKFPVFGPIKTKNGKEIISHKKHHGYLREFTKAKEKLNPPVIEVKRFGEVLGWLHLLTENYKTKSKRNHIFDLKETQRHFKENKPKILQSNLKNKKEFVEKFEKEIFSLNFPENLPSGMIHEDLGKRHVLWQKDKVAAIVDFDRSYYGKLILDLGQACRSWCFTNNWKKWSNQNFRYLIGGYQKKRKLSKSEKRFLVDAIKFGILERGMSFCLRFIMVTQDKKDREFAFQSIFEHLKIMEQNRIDIEKWLKIN